MLEKIDHVAERHVNHAAERHVRKIDHAAEKHHMRVFQLSHFGINRGLNRKIEQQKILLSYSYNVDYKKRVLFECA